MFKTGYVQYRYFCMLFASLTFDEDTTENVRNTMPPTVEWVEGWGTCGQNLLKAKYAKYQAVKVELHILQKHMLNSMPTAVLNKHIFDSVYFILSQHC